MKDVGPLPFSSNMTTVQLLLQQIHVSREYTQRNIRDLWQKRRRVEAAIFIFSYCYQFPMATNTFLMIDSDDSDY